MFTPSDFLIIGFLVFLEGILSIDNALVLALLARNLPPDQRRRALTYGLIGAVVFRGIAVFMAASLIRWTWVKYVGGGYLIFIAGKKLIFGEKPHEENQNTHSNFWKTVLVIELTDIAFAVDSILAAVALTSKIELVVIGGILGTVLMRFAATVFLKLLERFPRFEKVAYVLVLIIGIKVILEALRIPGIDFHSPKSPAFLLFWGLMLGTLLSGFRGKKSN